MRFDKDFLYRIIHNRLCVGAVVGSVSASRLSYLRNQLTLSVVGMRFERWRMVQKKGSVRTLRMNAFRAVIDIVGKLVDRTKHETKSDWSRLKNGPEGTCLSLRWNPPTVSLIFRGSV